MTPLYYWSKIILKKIIELIKKYKDMISYVFFGGCTTVIDIAVYYALYNIVGVPNVPSTVISWFVAVIFAFITNKLFVFESKSFSKSVIIKEASAFFACRILTGVLDVVVMYLAVDVAHLNSTLWKLLSNILVVIINYIASKLLVFKKK